MRQQLISFLYRMIDKLEGQELPKDVYEVAVHKAFVDVGLPDAEFSPDYDLVKAGKLTDVYHNAARLLDIDPELNTVGDVIKWLKS